MKITILCPSPLLKDKHVKSIADTYIKRMNSIINVDTVNVKISNNDSDDLVKKKQGDALLIAINKLPSHTAIITLDERGKDLDSRAFAKKLVDFTINGYSDICIVIGGAFGLSPDVLEKSNIKISLGKMVWPHRMVGIMILEQLYRAQQINSGHPYHKD